MASSARSARITVLYEAWRPHPLAWIHRGEARAVARELKDAGHDVVMARFRGKAVSAAPGGVLLLRLSDPVMLEAARRLDTAAIAYAGPAAAVMERCYDKFAAAGIAGKNGIEGPATVLADDAGSHFYPLVLKPRRGSDSIGVRVVRRGPLPARARNSDYIAQEQVRGMELTVGVLGGRAGMPLRIELPEGAVYSFLRKYVARPRIAPLADAGLAQRAREAAARIASVFGAGWAARIDMIHEPASGRLNFLECDVAPLIGRRSAFAASLAAAGIERAEQLRLLLDARPSA